jgi:DNA-binding CsgD family transcriptional regulator
MFVAKRNKNQEPRGQMPLTPREREILGWVAEGKRDGEIATILNLSVRTVEQHVRSCLRKFNVETRSALCAAVWRAKTDTGKS